MPDLEDQDGRQRKIILAAIIPVVLLIGVYWNLQYHDFINYDDPTYITENYYVKRGLTWEGIKWAFRDIHTGYWHPLTWISHMMDCQLFGLRPGGHHWTSLIFHILNTLLLFHIFRTMTGELWKSGFVACLFAIHPLNVESVAWIAERKNVLCAFFWMATVCAYIRYDQRPSFLGYLNVLVLFVAGLLAKPMVVTLPFVLLLIDFWPLRRFSGNSERPDEEPQRFRRRGWGLVIEKTPLFVLSFAASAGTLWAVRHEQGLATLDLISISTRISHAMVSYVDYLGKLVLPINLSVFYPHPMVVPLWKTTLCALLLIFITVVCLSQRRERPYLHMGWLWYLGVLFPVIGILQAGHQAMADRYAYLPFIGIFIMIAWGGVSYLKPLRCGKLIMGVAALTATVFFGLCTWVQLQYWENSVQLFSRALDVTSRNWVAHNNLGAALLKGGRVQESMSHFQEVLKIKPDYTYAHNNVGLALTSEGRNREAQSFYLEALRYRPNFVEAYNNIGVALSRQDRYEEALVYLRKALHFRPLYPEALNNVGYILARQNRDVEAIDYFNKALQLKPDYPEALNNLGSALAQAGRTEEGIERFREALLIAPEDAMTHNNMGIALSNLGRYEIASRHFEEVLRIDPRHKEARMNLEYVRSKMRP